MLIAAGNSVGDEEMSTTCGPWGALRLRGMVSDASTRPLSYSPQMTMAAPER